MTPPERLCINCKKTHVECLLKPGTFIAYRECQPQEEISQSAVEITQQTTCIKPESYIERSISVTNALRIS